MEKNIQVAIDGPASAGKSTVAKILAKKMGYIYCDTGAMYRALTYMALKKNVDLNNEKELLELLNQMTISFDFTPDGQLVYVNDEEVTSKIRQTDVTNNVSIVSAYKTIREEMVNRQKQHSLSSNIVMDGRDIGTVVLPDATLKIFLVASAKERAERRYKENIANGIPSDLKTLQAEIEARDHYDTTRENSPLTQADDAILIDTTGMSIEEVVKKIEKRLKS